MYKKHETTTEARVKGLEATARLTSMSPMLSVIVPVYNGTAVLKQCLAALAQSRYEDFEVLVVDDGSTEPVAPIATAYGYGYMRLDDGPDGPARARNFGAAKVQGQYLVFIDADVCVHPNTLSQLAEAFAADPTIDGVIGSYDDAPLETNFLSRYKNLFHHYTHQRCDGDINTFWSGCGAIRRELFLACGGFDAPRYRRPAIEDIELGTWLSAIGHRIILDRRIQVKHLKRWTLWKLFKTDVFDRGIPWIGLMWRTGTMGNTLNDQPLQRLSVVLVYLMGLSIVLAVWWPEAWIATGVLALAILMLNLDCYRYFTIRQGLWFAMRVVPLHWLYFGYCGFCVVWGSLLHYLKGEPQQSNSPPSPTGRGPG